MEVIPLDKGKLNEQWYGFMQSVVGKVQARFYELSEQEGTQQKDIAARLGHSDAAFVSRCLSGQKNMTLRTLHDLSRAMDSRLEIVIRPLDPRAPKPGPRKPYNKRKD